MKQLIGITVSLFVALPATAVPIVSIDTDPSLPGIQSSLDVDLGQMFSVDVFVEGVDILAPLNAYEFDVLYGPAILGATAIADAGFLLAPAIVVESALGPPEAGLAALTLAPIGAFGSGVLGSITFSALAAGSSALTLNDVILSAPFGQAISGVTLNDASIRVLSAQPVPTPSTLSLLLFGLTALLAQKHTRTP